ncbi:VOC family protein [Leptospira sp. 96542]|nr:VOC family protein [Leptospira sp. 96542]
MEERKPTLDFYSYNLHGGEDTQEAVRYYQSFLGGVILKESFGHSELQLDAGAVIVFSKQTENCPVRPGTITLKLESPTVAKQFDWKSLATPNQSKGANKPKYNLFEDRYGNWIWAYFTDSK